LILRGLFRNASPFTNYADRPAKSVAEAPSFGYHLDTFSREATSSPNGEGRRFGKELTFKPFEVSLTDRWKRIKAAIVSQRRFKHMSATMNKHATIDEPLEEMFSVKSVPRLYSEDRREVEVEDEHVEAGSYTSTVALRVVGGDEKGTQCLGV
jgi:hypothetical protein